MKNLNISILGFFARIFDFSLFYLVSVAVSLILGMEQALAVESSFVLMLLLWPLLEALFLKSLGKTLGMALAGLEIRKLPYVQALRYVYFFDRRKELVRPIESPLWAKIASLLLPFSLMGLFYLALPAPSYDEEIVSPVEGWVHHSSRDGSYEIDFPAKPDQEQKVFEIPEHDLSFPFQEWHAVDEGKRSFSVSYLELPRKVRFAGAKTILTTAMQTLVHQSGGDLISQNMGKHKHHPALFYAIKKGDSEVHTKLIVAKGKLYKLEVIHPEGTVVANSEKNFLDSFKPTLGKTDS